MKIAIDIDEVLVDFVTNFLRDHNRRRGTALSKEDISSYRMWELWGETKEESDRSFEEFYNSELFRNLEPAKESIWAVNNLSKDHELHIISSRPETIHEFTRSWVQKHFPNCFSGIHFSKKRPVNGKSLKKAEISAGLGVDLIIEDSLEYAKECAERGIRVLLFDAPWNQSEKLPHRVYRVFSWTEAFNIINTNFK
jgi:uncharacterized HAD superfamily protein